MGNTFKWLWNLGCGAFLAFVSFALSVILADGIASPVHGHEHALPGEAVSFLLWSLPGYVLMSGLMLFLAWREGGENWNVSGEAFLLGATLASAFICTESSFLIGDARGTTLMGQAILTLYTFYASIRGIRAMERNLEQERLSPK